MMCSKCNLKEISLRAKDGCKLVRDRKRNVITIQISTQSFTKEEIEFLILLLREQVGVICKPSKVSGVDQYQIVTAGHNEAVKFIQYIESAFDILHIEKV